MAQWGPSRVDLDVKHPQGRGGNRAITHLATRATRNATEHLTWSILAPHKSPRPLQSLARKPAPRATCSSPAGSLVPAEVQEVVRRGDDGRIVDGHDSDRNRQARTATPALPPPNQTRKAESRAEAAGIDSN
jgi:hypothetical protein